MGFSVVGGKWLAEKNKMKASVAGTRLWKWLAVKSQKNKIKFIQKAIDKLNKALECIAEDEKKYLEQADIELKLANQYEKHASPILERKKLFELHAKECAVWRPAVVADLVVLEKQKKKEMDALHNGDFTTHMSFLFY
ncbi:hypothetical protein HA466_0314330 [Hirschfeldia incana]|nr:hypothetical protein HA466_0314330 [Hirschfeldia incana]